MDHRIKSDDASYESFQATRYFRSLDALRCVAILGVLWHHSGVHAGMPALFTRGYLGVDLFFVLSGFLITTILLREQRRNGSISVQDFYLRRILRIFPLYYAYLLFLCISYLFLHEQSAMGAKFLQAAPYYATYLSNWLPAEMREPVFWRSWSLSVEEQFYLLWPTILIVCGSRRVVPILVVFIAFALAGELGVFGPTIGPFATHLVPFSAIAIGVLLALVLDRPSGFRVFSSILGHKFSVLAAVGLLALLLLIPGNVDQFFRLAVHLSMAALVCSVVLREDHALSKLAQAPLLVHVGVVSYGIYVLHGQFGGLTDRVATTIASVLRVPSLGSNEILQFAILVPISIIAATISYYFFEAYFLKLKEKYSGRKRRGTSSQNLAIQVPSHGPTTGQSVD